MADDTSFMDWQAQTPPPVHNPYQGPDRDGRYVPGGFPASPPTLMFQTQTTGVFDPPRPAHGILRKAAEMQFTVAKKICFGVGNFAENGIRAAGNAGMTVAGAAKDAAILHAVKVAAYVLPARVILREVRADQREQNRRPRTPPRQQQRGQRQPLRVNHPVEPLQPGQLNLQDQDQLPLTPEQPPYEFTGQGLREIPIVQAPQPEDTAATAQQDDGSAATEQQPEAASTAQSQPTAPPKAPYDPRSDYPKYVPTDLRPAYTMQPRAKTKQERQAIQRAAKLRHARMDRLRSPKLTPPKNTKSCNCSTPEKKETPQQETSSQLETPYPKPSRPSTTPAGEPGYYICDKDNGLYTGNPSSAPESATPAADPTALVLESATPGPAAQSHASPHSEPVTPRSDAYEHAHAHVSTTPFGSPPSYLSASPGTQLRNELKTVVENDKEGVTVLSSVTTSRSRRVPTPASAQPEDQSTGTPSERWLQPQDVSELHDTPTRAVLMPGNPLEHLDDTPTPPKHLFVRPRQPSRRLANPLLFSSRQPEPPKTPSRGISRRSTTPKTPPGGIKPLSPLRNAPTVTFEPSSPTPKKPAEESGLSALENPAEEITPVSTTPRMPPSGGSYEASTTLESAEKSETLSAPEHPTDEVTPVSTTPRMPPSGGNYGASTEPKSAVGSLKARTNTPKTPLSGMKTPFTYLKRALTRSAKNAAKAESPASDISSNFNGTPQTLPAEEPSPFVKDEISSFFQASPGNMSAPPQDEVSASSDVTNTQNPSTLPTEEPSHSAKDEMSSFFGGSPGNMPTVAGPSQEAPTIDLADDEEPVDFHAEEAPTIDLADDEELSYSHATEAPVIELADDEEPADSQAVQAQSPSTSDKAPTEALAQLTLTPERPTPKALFHSVERTTRKTRGDALREEILAEKQNNYQIVALEASWDEKIANALMNGHGDYKKTDFARVVPTNNTSSSGTGQWLNDEVINGYLKLVAQHGKQHDRLNQVPSYHAFSTFFYSTLAEKGHDGVRRWANKAKIGGKNLLEVEALFIPINSGAHWTLCVVSGTNRTMTHYNSMRGSGRSYINTIKSFVSTELGSNYKESEWTFDDAGESPRQANMDDCGVFAVTSARQIMLGLTPMSYGPGDVPLQRRRIVAELVAGGLLESD